MFYVVPTFFPALPFNLKNFTTCKAIKNRVKSVFVPVQDSCTCVSHQASSLSVRRSVYGGQYTKSRPLSFPPCVHEVFKALPRHSYTAEERNAVHTHSRPIGASYSRPSRRAHCQDFGMNMGLLIEGLDF